MTDADRIAALEAELELARRDADDERSTREALDRRVAALRLALDDHAIVLALRAERFDPLRNEVTICGVRYSIDLFEHLGVAAVGDTIRVERRDGETLTLRRLDAREDPS